eukprot:UN01080
MGLAIAFIIILVFMQLASPGLRQIGDFVGAIYSPYTTYGQDEINRYDTYYGDYTEEAVGGSRQYRPLCRGFKSAVRTYQWPKSRRHSLYD